MGIQINGATDSITAIDGTIDVVSAIGNAGVLTATAFVGNITGNVTGNINHTSNLELQTGGVTRAHFNSSGHFGIAGISTFSSVVTASQGVRVPNGSATTNYISVGDSNALRFWATTHSFADIRNGNLHFRNNSLQNILEIQQDKDIFLYGPSYFLDTARFDQTVTIADTITHHGDTDTKIRFPAADQISFETAGTNRLKIHTYSSNNNVEVDASAHLSLADNGSNGRFIYIGDGDASSTGYMHLQPGGGSQGFGGGIRLYSHSNSTNAGGVYIGKSHASSGAIIFGNGGMSPLNEYARINSSGHLSLGGSNVTDVNMITINGTGASQNIGIVLNKTNSPARAYGINVNNTSGDLIFFDYTANTERLRITSGGRVLINNVGNATPGLSTNADDLVIGYGTQSGETGMTMYSTTASGIRFNDNSGTDAAIEYSHSARELRFNSAGANRLQFGVNASNSPVFSLGSGHYSGDGNNHNQGDRASVKVGAYLHLESGLGGGHNAKAGLGYNCYFSSNENFNCGTKSPSGGDNRPAAYGMGYGNHYFYSDASNTAHSAQASLTMTKNMVIYRQGYVTKPYNLCLQYTKSSSNVTTGSVIYDTEVFDVGNSDAYNTSNGEFTAPITGVYRIQFEYFAAGAGRATANIEKSTNGGSSWSVIKIGMRVYSQSSGSNWASVPTIYYAQLNANDKIRITHREGTIHLNTPWNHLTIQLVQ